MTILNPELFDRLDQFACRVREIHMDRVKTRQIRKFQCLYESYYSRQSNSIDKPTGNIKKPCHVTRDTRCVENLSSRVLPDAELTLLEKGLNYNISKKQLSAEELIPKVEPVLTRISPDIAERLRSQLVDILKTQEDLIKNITSSK